MQPIFILIGPPAAGKSTTSKALASTFSKSIHLPVDDIRNMVVSGLALPGLEWSSDLTLQVRLARESAIQTARIYQRAGFAVVIDDFFDPNQLEEYQAFLDEPEIHRFVLFPDQDTTHARNSRRAAEDDLARAYIDAGIRIVYPQLKSAIGALKQAGWNIIDTTDLTIDQTVLKILKLS